MFILYQCTSDLEIWKAVQGVQLLQKIALFTWIQLFYNHLVSKVTFYFSRILRKKEEEFGGDFKSLLTHTDTNYIAIIEEFTKKTECYNFSIILEGQALKELNLDGYICPQYKTVVSGDDEGQVGDNQPTGLSLWPAIYSFPDNQTKQHWPNLISIIMDKNNALNKYKPYYFFDPKLSCTYFLCRVDTYLTMVLIYIVKKQANDKSIQDFLTKMTRYLTNLRVFGHLKQKSKAELDMLWLRENVE